MEITREYFYSIDGRGRLFHDATELTDEKFLNFFLKRLRVNDTGRKPEYPYVSPCGREMNYVRCADRVIVFVRLDANRLYYGPDLFVEFEPDRLRFDENGRLYHPAPVGDVGSIGPNLMREFAPSLRPWGPYYELELAERSHVIEPLPLETGSATGLDAVAAGDSSGLRVIRPRPENGCFGCGGSHGSGLALSFLFHETENSSRSWLRADERLQGAPGWMHGGFISLLLDEVMGKVLTGLDVGAPTANLNVDFRKPCRLGRELELRARLMDVQGRKHYLRGELLDITERLTGENPDAEPILLAEAQGLFLKIEGRPGTAPI